MSRALARFLTVVLLASFMTSAVASDRDHAELELMLAERRGLEPPRAAALALRDRGHARA